MDLTSLILSGFAVVALIYSIMLFNSLVMVKHNVKKNWSNIDVLLKQRHDELPNLVETCKQYMKYEQETLRSITEARSRVSEARSSHNVKELGEAESILRSGLGHLFAVAEDYPELKANESFQHLQNRITGLENAIADRRELYNDSVNINNTRIEQFPDLVFAKLFNFKSAELLEFSDEIRPPVAINLS